MEKEAMKTAEPKIEYIIKCCDCYVAEDNYEEGESNEHFVDYDASHIKSNTLEGLMRNFNDRECHGHVFNMDEWLYDPETPNRLELTLMGKLLESDYIVFEEPSTDDWEDFRGVRCNLTSFTFNLYIEKHEITTDFVDDFEKLGVSNMW